MSLIDIWKTTPEQIGNKHVKQVIAFAGAGKLSDDSATPVSLADCNTPRRVFTTFNYALTDFVRAVRRPKPLHEVCPVTRRCDFYRKSHTVG